MKSKGQQLFSLLKVSGIRHFLNEAPAGAARYMVRRAAHIFKIFKPRARINRRAQLSEHEISGRRMLLKGMAGLPFLGGAVYTALANETVPADGKFPGNSVDLKSNPLKDLKGSLPTGKVGGLEITRLVMGSNLLGGGMHSRDLYYVRELAKRYHTREKIFETLALVEQAGVNTTNMSRRLFPIFNEYRKITGSKLMTVAQAHVVADWEDPLEELKVMRDFGTTNMYIQGTNADTLVKNGRLDLIADALEWIRQQDMPAGIAAHSIEVLIACQETGIKPDYYYKTMHHDRYWSAHPKNNREEFSVDGIRTNDHNGFHDNIFDLFPEKTIQVIRDIDVPVFGFKVLAAGAIRPGDGFRYAFESGADFICVGMFDWQVVENVNTTIEVLNGNLKRDRKWFA